MLEVQRLSLPELVRLHVSNAQLELRNGTLDLPSLEYLSVEQRGRAPSVTFDAAALLASPRLRQVRLKGAHDVINSDEVVARRPDVQLLVRA